MLTTIDTHTAGGPTRIVTGGVPPLRGASVAEKMADFQARFDDIRKLLMWEPRGHRDMFGAVITEPTHPRADVGAFFLTASGYLPACVHSAIGVATAGLATGFVPRPDTAADGVLRMEVPAGLIDLSPEYDGDALRSIAVRTAPAFVHTAAAELEIDAGRQVRACIAFSGVFFLLVDVEQLRPLLPDAEDPIAPARAADLAALGTRLLAAADHALPVRHPERSEDGRIALAMIYEVGADGRVRDIVIGRAGGIDRSPCGAGTGAMLAMRVAEGKLETGRTLVLDSFLGTRFTGRALSTAEVGTRSGIVPEIRGTAHVTGMHRFILDADDPLNEGFLIQ